jgi:hypothetical protein
VPRSVTVWDQNFEKVADLDDRPDVDYISFVNRDTHGIPALLSGRAAQTIEAADGEVILYVNTDLVPLMEVEK